MIDDKEVVEVNERITIGTLIKKNGYGVGVYQVLHIEDAGDHWRGKENLRLLCVAVHSSPWDWDEAIGRPDVQLSLDTIDTADIVSEWHTYPTIPLYEILDGKAIFECFNCGQIDYRRPSQASDPEPLCFECGEMRLRRELAENEIPKAALEAYRKLESSEPVSSDSGTDAMTKGYA